MSGILKYNQAKVKIFQLISEENLRVGDRIFPERELVEKLGLSLITLQRAMRELEQEKIISRIPRKGTFLNRPIRKIPTLGTILYIRIYKMEYRERFAADNLRNEVEMEMKAHHFNIIYRNAVHPDMELAQTAAGCAGIFVTGWLDEEWLSILQSFGLPLVVIGDNPYMQTIPTVTFNFAEATELLYNELLQRGCEKIGFINGGKTYIPAERMYVGFQTAAKKAGKPVSQENVLWSSQTHIGDDVTGFLDRNPDLDSIIVENGELDALLATLWKFDYSRKLQIAAIADKWQVLRPLSVISNPVVACFENQLVPAAANMMLKIINSEKKLRPKSLQIRARILTVKDAMESFIASSKREI